MLPKAERLRAWLGRGDPRRFLSTSQQHPIACFASCGVALGNTDAETFRAAEAFRSNLGDFYRTVYRGNDPVRTIPGTYHPENCPFRSEL